MLCTFIGYYCMVLRQYFPIIVLDYLIQFPSHCMNWHFTINYVFIHYLMSLDNDNLTCLFDIFCLFSKLLYYLSYHILSRNQLLGDRVLLYCRLLGDFHWRHLVDLHPLILSFLPVLNIHHLYKSYWTSLILFLLSLVLQHIGDLQ